jgi:hypothetical protein
MKNTQKLAAVAVTTICLASLGAPAEAKGREVVHRGSCSGAADWKLKVKADDGRLEVEGQVDSNRVGQRWTWRMVHNGTVSAHGSRTTRAPSGSFEVHRLLVDRAGTDALTWRARNVGNGQVCRGTVRF